MTLHCPCGAITDVVDSRPSRFGAVAAIRRRRKCRVCGERSTTFECLTEGFAPLATSHELKRQIETLKSVTTALNALNRGILTR